MVAAGDAVPARTGGACGSGGRARVDGADANGAAAAGAEGATVEGGHHPRPAMAAAGAGALVAGLAEVLAQCGPREPSRLTPQQT